MRKKHHERKATQLPFGDKGAAETVTVRAVVRTTKNCDRCIPMLCVGSKVEGNLSIGDVFSRASEGYSRRTLCLRFGHYLTVFFIVPPSSSPFAPSLFSITSDTIHADPIPGCTILMIVATNSFVDPESPMRHSGWQGGLLTYLGMPRLRVT